MIKLSVEEASVIAQALYVAAITNRAQFHHVYEAFTSKVQQAKQEIQTSVEEIV